jgi:hypothetical protein
VRWDRELRSSAEAGQSARSKKEGGGASCLLCHVINDYTFTSYWVDISTDKLVIGQSLVAANSQ